MAYEEAVFSPDLASPRVARSFLRRTLDAAGVSADLAVLLVSELATNAVLHARTDFAVRIWIERDHVRVEVQDANERPPMIGHTPAESTSGRGLHLVQTLSTSWGVEGRPDGKTVWFVVPFDHDREDAFAS
ncbi:MAG TPA: ATP-binding protein [Acidimicrobiales bacterium]|nr:ATP-binding protein [Acidimicrobiales bacterium]